MAKELVLVRFSSEKDVQEAAHLFFRGYSGLVRNEVMHRLVRSYTRERVLQLLGLVDYAKRIKGRAIASWEAHIPSRHSLLKSL